MRHVTDILRVSFSEEQIYGSAEMRKFWLERGSAIHTATHLHDTVGLAWDSLDPRIEPYVAAWRRFRAETGAKILASEVSVEHPTLDYCGRLDKIVTSCAVSPGRKILVDIKTTAWTPIVKLQTMAYKIAYRRQSRARLERMVVALRADGSWRSELFADDALDTAAWLSCINMAVWKARQKQ